MSKPSLGYLFCNSNSLSTAVDLTHPVLSVKVRLRLRSFLFTLIHFKDIIIHQMGHAAGGAVD